MKPKYRIVRYKHWKTMFNVEKKTLIGWRVVFSQYSLSECEQFCENAINPVIKEY